MTREYMSTREVAAFLDINEKQVYALAKEGSIPATRATGKWIFPRRLIVQWLEQEALSNGSLDIKGLFILSAGSHDPILDILINRTINNSSHKLFSCTTGSTKGLKMVEEGISQIAFCHLFHDNDEEKAAAILDHYIPSHKIAIVHLFTRTIGVIHNGKAEESRDNFFGLTDGKTFINRQEGSGTRLFIDTILRKENIDPASIAGYDNEVSTHTEVAMAVKSGQADGGIGSISAAKMFNLDFIELDRESFDMVILQDTFFLPIIQTFIEELSSQSFCDSVRTLGNYDFTHSGKIIYSRF